MVRSVCLEVEDAPHTIQDRLGESARRESAMKMINNGRVAWLMGEACNLACPYKTDRQSNNENTAISSVPLLFKGINWNQPDEEKYLT